MLGNSRFRASSRLAVLASLVLASLALVDCRAPALAQDDSVGSFRDLVEVELVNVELWVSNSQGEPVSGLQAADFRLSHDGEPVPITNFSEIRDGAVAGLPKPVSAQSGAAVSAASPAVTPVEAPGHLVVYFDQLHLQPASRKRLVRDLLGFVSTGHLSADRLLVLRQAGDLFIEVPFGSSGSDLKAGLQRLADSELGGAGAVATSWQVLRAIQDLWDRLQEPVASRNLRGLVSPSPRAGNLDESGAAGDASSAATSAQACTTFVDQIEPLMTGWVRERHAQVATTLSRLWDATAFLAALPRVKTLIYLGDGLESTPGSAVASFVQGVCAGQQQELAMSAYSEELASSFERLTAHANANRVTIHAFQGGDARPGLSGSAKQGAGDFRGARAFESTQRVSEQQGLQKLAEDTGGRAVFHQAKYRRHLDDVAQDMRNYYSLAYRPPPAAGGGAHRIQVEAVAGGLQVRHRRSYSDKDPDRRLVERLQGALYLGLVDNPLDVRLGADPTRPGEQGGLLLPLHVMVPVERLTFLPEGNGAGGQVRLKALALDHGTRALVSRERRFRVVEPAGRAGQWLDLRVELELAPGQQTIAVAVQDEASGEASFVSTTLEVQTP